MTPAETVAACINRANDHRALGQNYAAGEWLRAADDVARESFGTDAHTVMRIVASLSATATVERGRP